VKFGKENNLGTVEMILKGPWFLALLCHLLFSHLPYCENRWKTSLLRESSKKINIPLMLTAPFYAALFARGQIQSRWLASECHISGMYTKMASGRQLKRTTPWLACVFWTT
jgi:hypothetical protein